MNEIQKKYPEVHVDNHGKFEGILNGSYSQIQITKRMTKLIAMPNVEFCVSVSWLRDFIGGIAGLDDIQP